MKYYPAVVTSREQLARLVVAYSEFDHFAVDLETIGTRESRAAAKTKDVPALDEMTNQVLWIGMAGPGRVDCIPLGHPEGPVQLRRSEVLSALKPLFFSDRLKINQNIKFDILTLAKYWGEIPPGPYLDTGTLVHIFNENLREYNLGYLVEHYLGFSYRKLAKEGTPMDKFPFWDVALYAGLDAKLALLLYQKIWGKISDKETLKNVLYLEMEVTEVLMWAKQRGICFNKLKIQELDTVLGQQLTKLSEDIYAAAGRKFLITSDQQKAVILYGPKDEGALGLPCKIMTPGGKVGKPQRSTSKRALQAISSKHPIVPMLMRHAELSKLKSAFTTGLAPHVEDDGRVRASLKQSGTVTGRFSCTSPNLQQIPRQNNADDDGARIRSMFEAGPGHVLVVGDYAQVEARLMGHFAGPLVKSSNLIKAFTTDIDFHTLTAAGLFGKPLAAITKEERQAGKTANFLLIFGGSPDRLIETGGYPKRVAELMHKGFHETYPEINKYANEVARRCHAMNTPYTETILGRRRRLPEINHIQGGKWIVARAERQAMNHIIQGSAADVNKMAMVRAHNLIKERWSLDTWRVILTVHDEIILEVPERYAEQGIELLKEAMEQVEVKLRVPLVADVHSGLTWSAAK